MTRRERIDELLDGSVRMPAMERTFEYSGYRVTAAVALALLEVADAIREVAGGAAAINESLTHIDEIQSREAALEAWRNGQGRHPDD